MAIYKAMAGLLPVTSAINIKPYIDLDMDVEIKQGCI